MAQYFCTTGAITNQFPLAAQINTGNTTTTGTYANSFFKATDSVVLRGILFLAATPTAETITLVDKAGSTIISIGVPANAAFRAFMPIQDGIPMPIGGFGVTTSVGQSLMFLFDRTSSVYVAN